MGGEAFPSAELCLFSLGPAVHGLLSSWEVVSHASSASVSFLWWCAGKLTSSNNPSDDRFLKQNVVNINKIYINKTATKFKLWDGIVLGWVSGSN